MDKKFNSIVNKKIGEILNSFIGEQNSIDTRDKIAYKVKCFLEEQFCNFETLNLYTPPEKIDLGLVDIKIDNELYPFSEIIEINEENWFDYILKWEVGEVNVNDVVILFQYLINEGYIWQLDRVCINAAEDLIEAGYCTVSDKKIDVHCIWGDYMIPSKYDLEKGLPGTDEYVQKRKELDDDKFLRWSNNIDKEMKKLNLLKARLNLFREMSAENKFSIKWAKKNIFGLK